MQPVGELDENDADVARHRQQHLAEIFRLRLFLRLKLDAGDLGNAVDQTGDVGAEFLGEFSLAVPVSSMTSCRMAADSVRASRRMVARMCATAIGW